MHRCIRCTAGPASEKGFLCHWNAVAHPGAVVAPGSIEDGEPGLRSPATACEKMTGGFLGKNPAPPPDRRFASGGSPGPASGGDDDGGVEASSEPTTRREPSQRPRRSLSDHWQT